MAAILNGNRIRLSISDLVGTSKSIIDLGSISTSGESIVIDDISNLQSLINLAITNRTEGYSSDIYTGNFNNECSFLAFINWELGKGKLITHAGECTFDIEEVDQDLYNAINIVVGVDLSNYYTIDKVDTIYLGNIPTEGDANDATDDSVLTRMLQTAVDTKHDGREEEVYSGIFDNEVAFISFINWSGKIGKIIRQYGETEFTFSGTTSSDLVIDTAEFIRNIKNLGSDNYPSINGNSTSIGAYTISSGVKVGSYIELNNYQYFTIGCQNLNRKGSSISGSGTKLSLKGDSDILLNGNSWNDLYRQVQSLYGTYISFNIIQTTAYTTEVPADALTYASVNKVGGMSYKTTNLIVLEDVEETTTNGITYSVKDGVITLNGTPTTTIGINIPLSKTIQAGTYSLKNLGNVGSGNAVFGICYSNAWEMGIQLGISNTSYKTVTTTEEGIYLRLYLYTDNTYENFELKPILVTGSNEPTTWSVGFNGIRNSAVTKIEGVSSLTIPSEVQALDGYGLGVNETYYNYIDFENSKFIKNVDKITLDGTFTNTTTITTNEETGMTKFRIANILNYATRTTINGNLVCNSLPSYISCSSYSGMVEEQIGMETTNLYVIISTSKASTLEEFKTYLNNNPLELVYSYETPTEESISEIDNIIEVEASGNITFINEYSQAVPNEIGYEVSEV